LLLGRVRAGVGGCPRRHASAAVEDIGFQRSALEAEAACIRIARGRAPKGAAKRAVRAPSRRHCWQAAAGCRRWRDSWRLRRALLCREGAGRKGEPAAKRPGPRTAAQALGRFASRARPSLQTSFIRRAIANLLT
jgi:hypothetical protein